MPALGFLGRADLAADIDTLLCTMDEPGIVNVLFANRNATPVKIRIAITSGGLPAAADYIEYDPTVDANQPMERTGLSLSSGEKIYVRSNATNVSARANGVPSQ